MHQLPYNLHSKEKSKVRDIIRLIYEIVKEYLMDNYQYYFMCIPSQCKSVIILESD